MELDRELQESARRRVGFDRKRAKELRAEADMLEARAEATAERWQLEPFNREAEAQERAELGLNPERAYECGKCDNGVILDPDYGSGDGPYFHERCDCPAGKNATHPSWTTT